MPWAAFFDAVGFIAGMLSTSDAYGPLQVHSIQLSVLICSHCLVFLCCFCGVLCRFFSVHDTTVADALELATDHPVAESCNVLWCPELGSVAF